MGRKGKGWTKEGGVCACGVIRYLELKNLRQDETRRDETKCDHLLVLLWVVRHGVSLGYGGFET